LKNFTFACGFDDKLIKNFNITVQSLTFIRLKLVIVFMTNLSNRKRLFVMYSLSPKKQNMKHKCYFLKQKRRN